jgi:hypothetical protein
MGGYYAVMFPDPDGTGSSSDPVFNRHYIEANAGSYATTGDAGLLAAAANLILATASYATTGTAATLAHT